MNIRIIVEDAKGKHFTLPVNDVLAIEWQTEGDRPSLICRGEGHDTLVELPASIVRTIYRDYEKAKPAPRVSKAQRGSAAEPQPADADRSS